MRKGQRMIRKNTYRYHILNRLNKGESPYGAKTSKRATGIYQRGINTEEIEVLRDEGFVRSIKPKGVRGRWEITLLGRKVLNIINKNGVWKGNIIKED